MQQAARGVAALRQWLAHGQHFQRFRRGVRFGLYLIAAGLLQNQLAAFGSGVFQHDLEQGFGQRLEFDHTRHRL